jgi:hypothetical protein
MKGYGAISLDAHLRTLGLAIIVIPDPERPALPSASECAISDCAADRQSHGIGCAFLMSTCPGRSDSI